MFLRSYKFISRTLKQPITSMRDGAISFMLHPDSPTSVDNSVYEQRDDTEMAYFNSPASRLPAK